MQTSDSVKVCIRARPFIVRESGSESKWDVDTHTINLKKKDGKDRCRSYTYDRVFDCDETTSDVYEEIAEPIVQSAMQGFNGTLFAYGQTASGKTYTMLGSSQTPGIIPLAVNEIFSHIEKTPEREFLLRVSYLEIYNENLKDLLAKETVSLNIREDEFKNVNVSGLTERMVTCPGDVKDFITQGERIRQMAATNMNDRSSRSHTIFKMIIESRERMDMNRTREGDDASAVKVAQLNFVDLAGSERASQTGAEGQRLKEGCYINKSLMILGQVINQICKDNESNGGNIFISFRDSKLTRILQPSLGGNALTAIICTITLAVSDETESTLRFASSAKQIKNKPQVNEVLSDEALLYRQKREINQLRKKVQEMEKQNEQNEISRSQQQELKEKIQKLTRMLLVSSLPADYTKKQQRMRRETWCPGANKSVTRSSLNYEFSAIQLPRQCENFAEFSSIDSSQFIDELEQEEKSRNSETLFRPQKRHFDDLELAATVTKKTCFAEVESIPTSGESKRVKFEKDHEQFKVKKNFDVETEYQKKIESFENELEVLRNQLREANEEKEMKICDLEVHAKMQNDVIQQFLSEQNVEEEEKQLLKSKIKDLSSKIVDFERRDFTRRNSDTSGMQANVQELYVQLCDAGQEKRKLQEQLDVETERSRSLISDVDRLSVGMTKVKEDAATEIEEYKDKVLSLQSQLEATLSSTKSSDQTDQLSVENEVFLLKSELSKKELLIVELQASLTNIKERHAETKLNSEKEILMQEHDGTTNENAGSIDRPNVVEPSDIVNLTKTGFLGDKTQCLEEAIQHCEMLIHQKELVKKEMDDLLFKMLEKDENINDLKATVDQLNITLQTLEEQVEFDKEEKQILLEEEKKYHLEVKNLKEQIKSNEACMQETDIKHNQILLNLQTKLSEMSKEMSKPSKDQMNTICSLKKAVEVHEKSAEDAQALLQDSNRLLSKAQGDMKQLQQTIKQQDVKIVRLESDLESYIAMAEISAGSGNIKHHLERSVNEDSLQSQDEKKKLNWSEIQEEEKILEITDDLNRSSLQVNIEQHHTNLMEAKALLAIKQKQLSSSESSIAEKEKLILELQNKSAEISQENKLMKAELAQLRNNELGQVVNDDEEYISHSNEHLTELQEEIDLLKLDQKRKLKEFEHLQSTLSKREGDLECVTEELTKMQTLAQNDMEKEKSALEEQNLIVMQKQQEIGVLGDKVINLEKMMQEKESELEKSLSDLKENVNVINKLKIKIEDLERCLTEDKAAQVKLLEDQEHLSDVEKNFMTLYQEFTQLTEKHTSVETEAEKNRNELDACKVLFEEKCNTLEKLQNDLTKERDMSLQMQEELNKERSQHNEETCKISELKTQLLEYEEKLSNLTDKLVDERNTEKENYFEMEDKVSQLQEPLKSTGLIPVDDKSNLSEESLMLVKLKEQEALILTVNKNLEETTLEKNKEIQSIQYQLEKAKEMIGCLETKVIHGEKLLETKALEYETHSCRIEEMKQELETVKDENIKIGNKGCDHQNIVTELQEEIDLMKLDQKRKLKEFEHLQSTLSKREEDLECVTEELTKMQSLAQNDMKKEKSALEEQNLIVNRKQEEIGVLGDKVINLEKMMQEKESELEKSLSDLKENVNIINKLKIKIEDLERCLTEDKAAQVKLLEDQEHLSDVEKNFMTLYQEFTQLTEKHTSVETEAEKNRNELDACKVLFEEKCNTLEKLQNDLTKERDMSLQMQEELNKERSQHNEETCKISELKTQLLEYEEKLNSLTDKLVDERNTEKENYFEMEDKVSQLQEPLKSTGLIPVDDKSNLSEESLMLVKLKEQEALILAVNKNLEETTLEKNKEIQSIQCQLEKAKEMIGCLETKVIHGEKLLETKALECETHSCRIEEMNQELETVKDENIKIGNKGCDHQSIVTELEEEIDLMKLDQKRKLKEFEHLQSTLSKREGDLECVTEELTKMQTLAQNDMEKEKSALEEQNLIVMQKQQEIGVLGDKVINLEKMMQEKESELEKSLSDLKENVNVINKLKIKIEDLERCLTEDKAAQVKLLEDQEHLSDVEKNFMTLYQEFTQLTEKHTSVETEAEKNRNELDACKVLFEEKCNALEKLQNDLTKERDMSLQMQEELNKERSQHNEETCKISELKTQLLEYEEKLNSLTDKLVDERNTEKENYFEMEDKVSQLQEPLKSTGLIPVDDKSNLSEESLMLVKLKEQEALIPTVNKNLEETTLEKNKEIQSIQYQLEKAKEMIGCLETKVIHGEKLLETKALEYETHSCRIEEMKQELETVKDENIKIGNKGCNHQNIVTELEEEIDLMKLDQKRKLKEFEHLQSTLSKREEDLECVTEELTKMQSLAQNDMKKEKSALEEQNLIVNRKQEEIGVLGDKVINLEKMMQEKESELEKSLSDLKENVNIINKLKIKIEDLERCLTEDKAAQVKLLEDQEHLSDVEKNFMTLYQEFTQLTEKHTSVETEAEKNRNELDACKVLFEEKCNALEKSQNDFTKEKEISLQMQKSCTDVAEKSMQLQTELQTCLKERSDLEYQVLKLNKEKLKHEQQIETVRSNYDEKHAEVSSECSKLQQLLTDKDYQIHDLQVKVNELQMQAKEFDTDLEKAIRDSKEEIRDQTEKNVQNYKIALEDSVKQLNNKQAELDDMREMMEKLLKDKKENVLPMKEEISSLQKVVEERSAQVKKLEQSIQQCYAAVHKYKNKIKELEEDKGKHQTDGSIDGLKKEMETMQLSLKKRSDRILELEGLLQEYDIEINEYKEKIAKLENMKELPDRGTVNTEQMKEVACLKQNLQEKNDKLMELENLLEQRKSETVQTKENYETMQAKQEIAVLEEKLEKRSNRVRELEQYLRLYPAELKKYKSKVKQLQESKENHEIKGSEDVLKLKQEMETMDTRVKKRGERILELEGLLQTYDREIDEYKENIAELQKSKEESKDGEALLAKLKVENKDLHHRLEETSNSLEKSANFSSVQQLKEQLQNTKEAYQQQISSLEDQLKLQDDRMFRLKEQLRLQSQHDDSMASSQIPMTTRSMVFPGGFVQRTKLDIQEREMTQLKRQKMQLEKELKKYKDIEEARRAENQALLDQNNKFRRYIRKFQGDPLKKETLQGKSTNVPEQTKCNKSSVSAKSQGTYKPTEVTNDSDGADESVETACKSQ